MNSLAQNSTVYTDPEYMWVEVKSHRGRDYLVRAVGGSRPRAFRPSDIMKNGEYYRVHRRHTEAVQRIKGVTIRPQLRHENIMPYLYYNDDGPLAAA